VAAQPQSAVEGIQPGRAFADVNARTQMAAWRAIAVGSVALFAVGARAAGEDSAASAVAALEELEWNVPYQQWREQHPDVACDEARSRPWETKADDEWCYRCAPAGAGQPSDREELSGRFSAPRQWWFYAFGEVDAPVCRLAQYRHELPGLARADEERARGMLEKWLSGAYGPGEDPGYVSEFGAGGWTDLLRWRDEEGQIYLYSHRGPVLLARSRTLLDALEEDELLDRVQYGRQHRDEIALQLARELAADFPAVATLLSPEPGRSVDQEQLRAALGDLRRAREAAPPGRRAALLLASDLLGRQVGLDWPSPESLMEVEELRFANHRTGWVYTHNLLQRLWAESPRHAWGEAAFLLLLQKGWHPGGCGRSDEFRTVIEKATWFLDEPSESRYRLAVKLALAQAYETWWSLGLVSTGDIYVEADYSEGAERARRAAVDLYSDVLREAPRNAEAVYVRRQLPRLKLGIATQKRRFFCIED
jgi:hypothetical protein